MCVCVTIGSSSCFSSSGLFPCTGHMHTYKTPFSWHRNSVVPNASFVCVCVCLAERCGVFLAVVKSMLMKHFS